MKDYPIIKVTLVFIAGIISVKLIHINLYFIFAFLIVSILLFIVSKRYKSILVYHHLINFILALLIFSIGNHYFFKNEVRTNPFVSSIDKVKNVSAAGIVDKIDLIRENELIFYLKIDSMYSDEFFVQDEFNLLCKVQMNKQNLHNLYEKLKPGNHLLVTGFYYKGREKRNPGEFDYNAYLNSKGIVGILKVVDNSSIKITSNEIIFYKNALHQIRKTIDEQLKKDYSSDTFSLLRGLLLADRGEINYETKTHFINAGVIHVLAVSGLNVGFIVLIFLLVFGRWNLYLRSVITIAGLIFYMIITGMPASVVRATIMAVVIIISFLSNRSNNLINSLAIAALFILVLDPNQLYDTGFQLSFSAVLSMTLLYPPIKNLIERYSIQNKFLKYLILMIGLSLSAQIGTLPFTFYYFSKFSTISLLANLIVIPLIGVITGIGIFTLIISPVIPFISIYFTTANDLITSFLFWIINYSGSLKFSYISVYDYTFYDSIIFYFFGAILIFSLMKVINKFLKLLVTILVILNMFIFSKFNNEELLPDNYLSVLMIDVGQGDSFLIKFPNGKTALVDAGNTTITYDTGERVIIPLLDYLDIEKIDYGIVTHIDLDHYAGFVSLVLNGRIREIIKTELDSTLNKDVVFEKFIRKWGVPIKYFEEQKLEIGNTALYFLFDENLKSLSRTSTNDRSGVFKLVYGNTSFLFTGDIERSIEKFYSNKYQTFLDSDVLKVGHHGSKTSSSQFFLNYVTPEVCLISAGYKNKFGHPVQEVIERFRNVGSTIYRSDLQKAILLRSNGDDITRINW